MDAIDRQRAFSGTRAVRDALRFDEQRLADYLAAHIEGFEGPIGVSQFKGGQSNPTYLVETASSRYVLRRKPPGRLLPSAHAVDREFRVIEALHNQNFPVARPHVLCADDDVIGTMFYVMDYVEGRIFWEPHLPDVERGERARIYDAMNATIAALHTFAPGDIGLGDFGKPQGYVARQIKRWSQQYQASETKRIETMDRLIAWLPQACPQDAGSGLVHGDFRLDNLIFDAGGPAIRCVLDWELSTLGDPLGDFTYHMMQWQMPLSKSGAGTGTLKGHDLKDLAIPAMERYVELYCERTGRQGIDNLDFYFAYNFFRLAAILQGIVGRVRDGTAASPHAAAMADMVEPLADTAWGYARTAGA